MVSREEMDALLHGASEVIEGNGRELRDFGHVFLTCYEMGAAAAFGLMGMAEAIRRNHLGILNVVRVRTKAGPIQFPPCDCEPGSVHTC